VSTFSYEISSLLAFRCPFRTIGESMYLTIHPYLLSTWCG